LQPFPLPTDGTVEMAERKIAGASRGSDWSVDLGASKSTTVSPKCSAITCSLCIETPVSPRSSCDSALAETPKSEARSRRLLPSARRKTFTRSPTAPRMSPSPLSPSSKMSVLFWCTIETIPFSVGAHYSPAHDPVNEAARPEWVANASGSPSAFHVSDSDQSVHWHDLSPGATGTGRRHIQ